MYYDLLHLHAKTNRKSEVCNIFNFLSIRNEE